MLSCRSREAVGAHVFQQVCGCMFFLLPCQDDVVVLSSGILLSQPANQHVWLNNGVDAVSSANCARNLHKAVTDCQGSVVRHSVIFRFLIKSLRVPVMQHMVITQQRANRSCSESSSFGHNPAWF